MAVLTTEGFSTVLNMLMDAITATLFNFTVLECLSCPFVAWYSVLKFWGQWLPRQWGT